MSWKKNIFSCFLWVIYILIVGILAVHMGNYITSIINYQNSAISYIITVFLFLIGFLLFVILRKVTALFPIRDNSKSSELRRIVVRSLIVVALLAIGMLLRVYYISYAGEESFAYYDIAQVTQNSSIPMVAHGAIYFYLQLLRGLFLVVGNKWMAGIWMQIVLHMIASLILYFSVRKFAGEVSAIIVFAFFMLSQTQIFESITYSPKSLYLIIYGIALYFIAGFFQKRADGGMKNIFDIILLLFVGAVIAFACYLDVSGITLLVIALGIIWMNKQKANSIWENSLLELLVLFVGTAVFFCGYLLLDATLSGKSFWGIWNAWRALYLAKGYNYSVLSLYSKESITFFVLVMALVLGVFSFWCRKGHEKISPWILFGCSIILLDFFGITTIDMNAVNLMCLAVAVLAGIGVTECFYQDTDLQIIHNIPIEPERVEQVEIHVEQEKSMETSKTTFIENPLPLPKKRARKAMNFEFQPDESQMKYDIEIDETDDFDII